MRVDRILSIYIHTLFTEMKTFYYVDISTNDYVVRYPINRVNKVPCGDN